MKLDKLVKQARRDLVAHPKKAAVLGLMLLVAAYFWGPLVWKWVAPAGKKGGKETQTALILEDDPVEAIPQAKAGALKSFRWQTVRQVIQGDRLMVSAVFEPQWPNPFAPLATADSATAAGVESPGRTSPQKRPTEFTPHSAGLKLASVAIGVRRRTATISGDTYREGETIEADGDGFRLVRIEAHGVELEREGKTWWLEFDRPSLAKGDEIEPASGDGRN